ncbi:peptidoglycan recognition protein [Streptomyces sp. NBC_01340]|uniref:peptidoglycan recognition protein family protein n=1 Tax=unclassified Streptomyces TaxID=2593676 RepID=UPI002251047C|nr:MULTISPECIES: peptidoglycan recognition protein [unclassified Streptomyces]MCX4454542.1 peptidoglycan recognition protein [Streptomyces sp. NBC_01719]MCX4493902.1 peptidoglycan recognition protein [Streptomyces sp. NBC_01728]WSI38993.1 peptidoglycan recognition protein [Streptomyces sp. NBC_01340]
MRGFLASSVGATCAAALTLPLALSAPAQARPQAARTDPAVPGSTQSLPLVPLSGDRSLGPAAPEQGLGRRSVRSFSLVGVVWDDPDAELRGRVQVRTRATGASRWSGWQDIETHNREHAADPDTAEGGSGRVRGSTAPLWVGDSDGVEVRVQAQVDERATAAVESPLPRGMHLELVDPGAGPAPRGALTGDGLAGAESAETYATYATNADLAPFGATELPALSRAETEREVPAARQGAPNVKPYIGERPHIVTRRGWGADENLREGGFVYTKKVNAAFVHHTASGNNYRCSQAPSVIRSIYRYHVVSSGWRDIGYNFLVDKCGNIYEGRAGGVAKPVMGAHTLGFNSDTMGIAVLGSFHNTKPSAAAVTAIARLTAWKLGLYGADPRGKTYLKSGGGNLYRKGKNVRLNVISGHRDGFATECPGRLLYGKLGSARTAAARYQGR